MLALVLYLATSSAIAWLWSRRIQRFSVAAAVALVALPLIPTGRALLTNRTLAPVDIAFMAEPLHAYASDYGVAQPYNLYLSDLHCQILPWQRAVRYSLAHGQWPLWNPFILGGDILAAAAQPAVYDPFQWIGMLVPLADAFTYNTALTFFLAAFFTFAFARALGMREIASLVAATGYMLCGMLAFFAGWPLGRAWAYLPLVLFATRERRWKLLTLAFVLLIVAGHPESVLHVAFVGALYGAFTRPRLGDIGRALVAGTVALLLTAVYLLPFIEAVPQTLEHRIRREIYAKTSYDVIAKPAARLERIQRTFVPGRRDVDPLSARVGTVILVLAIAGAIARRQWFFALLAIGSMLATFGLWPVAHALHALPLFDIAINERLAFAAAFSLSILAAFAVDAVRNRHLALAILAIVLLERAWDDGRVYPAIPREAFFPRIPLLAAIPRDARMTAAGFAFTANNPSMYALEDVRGYQAMTHLRRFETYALWSVYQHAWFNRIDDLSRPFLSFLNVRYAIGRGDPPEGWSVLAEDRGSRLFENTRELPRAFVPRRIRYEREGNVVVEAMQHATDFGDIAWIEAPEYAPHEIANGPGRVALRRMGLAYDLDVSMERDGWVVVSATAWNGWRATIDGRRVRTHYANHAFLGVFVPRGTHRVQLQYQPASFVRGRNISLATLTAVLFVALKRRKQPRAVRI